MLQWFYKKIASFVPVPAVPSAAEVAMELQKLQPEDSVLKIVAATLSKECYYSDPSVFEENLISHMSDSLMEQVRAKVVAQILQDPSLCSEISAQLMQRIVDKLRS